MPSERPSRPTAPPAPATAPADPHKGQLQARPAAVTPATTTTAGVVTLGLTKKRDTLLYVPSSYQSESPAPLVLVLHGAGGNAEAGLGLLQSFADAAGLLLLAPASRRATWDVIAGGYGPDVALIDQALAHVFAHYAVDPSRIAVGGFSDGASYALSLGVTNGDLFHHITAFSPGFMAPGKPVERPRVFLSHGTRDEVLPIDRCSRRIVPQLERAGYELTYHEFDGPHTVPPELARAAIDWLIAPALTATVGGETRRR